MNKKSSPLINARATVPSLRKYVALSLCAVLLLAHAAPSFAQRRTAIRLPKGAINVPVPRAQEREQEKGRETRRVKARQPKEQSAPLNYTPVNAQTETVGVPSVGEPGVQKTTFEIMAAQAAAPETSARNPRLMIEHEGPDRKGLPQDPNAKPAATMVNGVPVPVPVGRKGVKGISGAKLSGDTITPAAPQTVGTSFTGATLADTGAFPPDSMGAVGPSQFVVFVNGRIRTFNKTTGLADGVLNADPDVFFASVETPVTPPGNPNYINFTSDPQVRYDRLSGRWIMIIIDVPSTSAATIGDTPNRILIAVSDAASSSALTAGTVWTFYFIQQDTVGQAGGVTTGEFLDYPSLGVDNNALYIGGNMFSATTGNFLVTSGFVVQKSSILSGGPVVTTAFRGLVASPSSDGPFAPRGVDNYNPTANEGYFIGVSNAAFGRLVMRRVSTPGGVPTISANILITVNTTQFPNPVPHLGNTNNADTDLDGFPDGDLDALDDRLYAAHIRNGRIWTAHNIGVNNSGVATAVSRDAARWYELNEPVGSNSPSVVESGTIFDLAASNPRYYWIPSVMVSGQGHAAFGFSSAGNNDRVNAATNGRLATDAFGTSGAIALYTSTSGSYNPPSDPGPARRWGDYSFTSLDPQDDMTMWTIQEFCNANNSYGVRVAKLIAPPPATPISSSGAQIGQASVNIILNGTQIAGSGFYDPGTDLVSPALPFNHIAISITSGVTVNSITYVNPTTLMLNVNTTVATLGAKDVTVTNPDGQQVTGTGALTVTSAPTFSISGQVVNQSNVGVDGVTVKAVCAPSGINAMTTTAGGGLYSFPAMVSGDTCALSVPTVTVNSSKAVTPSNQNVANLSSNITGVNFTLVPIAAGDVIISEFRFRGSAGTTGASDEFVELYNKTGSPITVSTTDGSTGWSLVATNVTGTFSERFAIPNGTVIPAGGHFLGANSTVTTGYSLGAVATPDAVYTTGIVDGGGVALFTTRTSANYTAANRLDAAGFAGITGTTLFTEGTAISPSGGITTIGEYSFMRKLVSGFPQDTNNNANDFVFVSTTGGTFNSTASTQGAPGPESLTSPVQRNAQVKASLVDAGCSGTSLLPGDACARFRDPTPDIPNNSTLGTLSIRRKFTNNTGAPITQLRFRVVDITTRAGGASPPSGTADLRLRTSTTIPNATLSGGGTTDIQGLTLDAPSAANNGGLNSTVSAGTITLGSPLGAGNSINVHLLLGVQQGGAYRFFINIEALP